MPTLTSICLNRCCTTTRTPIDGLLRECAATRLTDGDTGSDGQGGISHLFSFVDDISSCVYLLDLHFLCEKVRYHGASIGCFVNPHKTRQWDLHPTCPYLPGSTLGALTLRFHCIILINTSFYRQNCSRHPCGTHHWLLTSWPTHRIRYLCLQFFCSTH